MKTGLIEINGYKRIHSLLSISQYYNLVCIDIVSVFIFKCVNINVVEKSKRHEQFQITIQSE